MSTQPTDELWERTRRLSAERLRPVPPPPSLLRNDLRELVGVLAMWLANPGPTDSERERSSS